MSLPTFRGVHFVSPTKETESLARQANDLSSAIADQFHRVQAHPSLDSVTVPLQALASAADTKFAHKLGRQPIGYRLGRVTAAATIFWVSWDATFITLHASAACSADVEVW